MKKTNELRELNSKDLELRFEQNISKLESMKFHQGVSPIEKPNQIRDMRRDNARILTIIRQREIAEEKKA